MCEFNIDVQRKVKMEKTPFFDHQNFKKINHFFTKLYMEFCFGLILIKISIELQLIEWRHGY